VDALKAVCAALALCAAAPAKADPLAAWRPVIAEASARFGVPVEWIDRVIRTESAGRTTLHGRPITSRAGAMGLMQLMPRTWTTMRRRLGLGNDPYQPRDNIFAGTYYLRLMYDRFGYPGLFAAYNAGPGRYADYIRRGRALPGETRNYLAAVTGTPTRVDADQPARMNALFFVRHAETAASGAMSSVGTLFVQHGASDDIVDGDNAATSR
jgi:soluble lytic murein transglycosylase-like protein